MIDPINMTRYGQTTFELQETLLFACCVAGKNAVTTARCLDNFLRKTHEVVYPWWKPTDYYTPFLALFYLYQSIGQQGVALMLKNFGIGCYNNRAKTFKQLIGSNIDLKTCSLNDLEKIWGIAEKTSRFFVLHTRENVRVAVLDTHIKEHMNRLGYVFPKGQPKGKKYLQLEQDFLKLADEQGESVAAYDLSVWNDHAGHKKKLTYN